MIFVWLFLVFLEIGVVGFGGGYGMLSLIQSEVVMRHGWITAQEFTDIVAVSQVTPGAIGINAATYCGYTAVHNAGYGMAAAIGGSVLATFALVLPSLLIMVAVAKVLMRYMRTPLVQGLLSGLRPAVIGLLFAAALLLMTADNFGSPVAGSRSELWHFGVSIVIFTATLLGTWCLKISPIRMILISALAGLLLY